MSAVQELYKVATPSTQYSFRVNLLMWPNRTLFFGPLSHLGFHSLGSVAVNIGLYKPFMMRTKNGQFKPYRMVIIPAGCEHEMMGFGNIVASLVIERNSIDYVNISKRASFQTPNLTDIYDPEWLECFQKIYEEKPSKAAINNSLNQLLNKNRETELTIDPRINNIIDTIRNNTDNNFSQEYLAASEGLSASRFRHLFREQFNVPYRRYRVWRKVINALNSFNKVDSLTHAAMEAGFTDSAHLNRSFNGTLGVGPSLIFKSIDRFEI